MINAMKENNFESITYEQWEEIAAKSLKGLPFDRLITKTFEGIDLQPLYTKDQYKQNEKMLDAIRNGIGSSQWTIAQQTYAVESKKFLIKVKESLHKGNEAIVYDGRWPVEWQTEDLKELAALAKDTPIYLFNIKENDVFHQFFSLFSDTDKANVKGIYIGEKKLPEGFINIRQAGMDTTEIHLQGADIITELAITLARAVAYSNEYESFKNVTDQFFVRFSIDTHFFMEIAKLRAFRVLWKALVSAYGEESNKVPVISETALRTYSNLDPYVNLLRAGNEAFSAVLGGTDVLTVHPHNVISQVNDQALRFARNIQLVIREETQVEAVLDPAGGSYFIESLTEKMVEKAWNLFLKIEELGGYANYMESNELQEKLDKLNASRREKMAIGEHVLVGTNSYADLTSEIDVKENENNFRLAKIYEDYREKFAASQPRTVLLGFGKLKEYKPIADFVKNYLASAGINALNSPEFQSVEEYKQWAETNDYDYGIICTRKDNVEKIVNDFLKMTDQQRIIDVAGNYKEAITADWKGQGINGLIYKGQNQLNKFASIEKLWEEVKTVE